MSARFTPNVMLCAAVALSMILAWVMFGLATDHRWMGLQLTTQSPLRLAPDYDAVWIAGVEGPSREAGVPHDQTRVTVIAMPDYHDDARSIRLEPGDLIEEPDTLATYTDMRAFFARQNEIAAILRGFVDVEVGFVEVEAEPTAAHAPRPFRIESAMARPISSLPPAFWMQIAVGLGGFWIGAWIWVLRRGEWATRFLAVAGAGLMISAFPAAVYSTRELALPGGYSPRSRLSTISVRSPSGSA